MILNVYKERTWTSFDVVAKVKNVLKVNKAGHAGTLDPLAEGVLIVLTDEDTKRQSEFMGLEKEYKFAVAFGMTSPTYDLEGDLKVHPIPVTFKLGSILTNELLAKYIGKITQTVPPFSAVKVDGQRLYKKARAGNIDDIELPDREVEVKSFSINSISYLSPVGFAKLYGKDVSNLGVQVIPVLDCTIICSKGTYIRSIANDLGADVGVGGVLAKLVRTRVGDFSFNDSVLIDALGAVVTDKS
ncbi:MAG: tRNA pseudouridine(55) synthase TruB [Patescibacteria group bacterium]